MNISFRNVIVLMWLVSGSARKAAHNKDDNFIPATQQPVEYFPQPRIVGGQNAAHNQYPHQISLRFFSNHICGGSIISANYILTAAHCVTTGSGNSIQNLPAAYLSIRAGSTNVNRGGIVVGVSKVIVHPNYKNVNNDIAVVRLNKSLVFSESIKAIALATKDPKVGVKVETSGWGRLRTNGATPQILQYSSLVTMSHLECIRRIGYIPKSLLCLGHTAGNGVCSGDSGGPAILNNQLIGVTNFVVASCGSNAPDGYASVPFFANWIKSVTDVK